MVYIIRVSSLAIDARIGQCWARDEQSTLQLSDDNGCSMQLAGNVWNHFQRQQHHNIIIFQNQIKAWAFPTSNDVNIFCNLHTCHITCHHMPCNEQRQRRNVITMNNIDDDDDDDDIHVIRTNFHVHNKHKPTDEEEDE
ncbi:unnamed protein product [Brugia timori]|uniref:ZP domain-containing protein n=1 Tax=Brugia timori TaxID=42155 RepID=A0A0R3R6I6_9BILA|nr:unnamed protein product [Brugia timori]